MRKLLILLLVSSLLLVIGAATMANTVDVNVDRGISVSLERPDYSEGNYLLTGKIGIGHTSFSLSYATETTNWEGNIEDKAIAGARCEFLENVAGTFEYTKQSGSEELYTIGLAAKKELFEPFALAGYAKYNFINYKAYNLLAQAEYSILEQWIVYAGLEYQKYDADLKSHTFYRVGLKFAPTEKVSCYCDYAKNNDNGNSKYATGAEYNF